MSRQPQLRLPDPLDFEASMWVATATPQPATGAIEACVNTEVAIIGGGFTGASAALHLAQAGTGAVILEAEHIGSGCSSRNQGNGSPTFFGAPPERVRALYGPEQGERMLRMVADSRDLVVALIRQHGIDCGLVENGCLWVAENDRQTRNLEDCARQWGGLGHRYEAVSRGEITAYIPTDRYVNGFFCAENFRVNPASYVRGIARAALGAGARIFTDSPALSIEPAGSRWVVRSRRGEVVASRVLIATNSHTGDLWPGLNRIYYRMPLAMFATEPYPDRGRSVLLKGVPFHDMSVLTFFGVFFDAEGRMICGIVPSVNQNTTDLERVTSPLNRKFQRVFPGLPKPEWKYLWAGTMAMTPDLTPRVFELADGVYAALGYSGSGICPATAVGREAAGLLSSGDPGQCAVPVRKLKTVPLTGLASGLMRWVVNPVMRQAYRFL